MFFQCQVNGVEIDKIFGKFSLQENFNVNETMFSFILMKYVAKTFQITYFWLHHLE